MTREEAIEILKNATTKDTISPQFGEAYKMAVTALENIGHLKDRPCGVCEFRKGNGCCKWDCVFEGVNE